MPDSLGHYGAVPGFIPCANLFVDRLSNSSVDMTSLDKLAGSDFAVVTYDQRGMARSTSPTPHPSSYDLMKYVEDLEAVRKVLHAEKIHLFGHSWGGIVAMRYATVYPERVESMILIGSGPPTWEGLLTAAYGIMLRIQELEEKDIIPKDLPPDSPERQEANFRAYFSDPTFWFSASAI